MGIIYLRTKDPLWQKTMHFWIRVFALTFALGVASGIPLPFAFGTNWARFSKFTGDILGGLLSAEGFFAFLVEAGFLGILLFGWDKISAGMHTFAAGMVSFGAHFSGFWIVIANAWMQNPIGYKLVKGSGGHTVAHISSLWEVVTSSSSLNHLTHTLFSAWLTAAFLMISIASYYLYKKRFLPFSKRSFKFAIVLAFSCCIFQLISADSLARFVAKTQPEKMAAMEGVYKTQEYTPAYAFGWVDTNNKKAYGLKVPGLLSLLIYRNAKTPVAGLDQFPQDTWPLVQPVFQFYHLMILMWGLMFLASMIGLYMWIRKKWVMNKWTMRFLIISVVFPQIANLAGWYATEMGRQPWVVYKLLRTNDAISPGVTVWENWISLIVIGSIYILLFVLFLFLLDQKIKHGPTETEEEVHFKDPFEKTHKKGSK
jgi:cytochrome d ubiquinol oxidase subunit I